MAPSTIQRGIERNQQRLANGGSSGTPLTQPVEATPAPNPPGAPQQDLPIMVPRRGLFPASLVLASDRSDNSREFRGAGARSATFPFPGGTGVPVATAAEEASIQSQLWDPKVSYPSGALVAYNGSTYVSNQPSQGQIPPSPNDVQAATAPATLVADDNWTLVGSGVADGISSGLNNAAVSVQATDPFGNIDLSLPGVLPNGSVAPNSNSAFTYSATTTTVTITWSSFNIFQVNGIVVNVTNGSQEVTGLTASTNYYAFPYYDPDSQAIEFVQESQVADLQALNGMAVAGSGDVTTTTNVTTNNASSQITIEGWVYPTSGTGCLIALGSTGPVVQLGLSGGSAYQLSLNGSSSTSGTVFGGTMIPNAWNYFVACFAMGSGVGGTCEVTSYLNGVATAGTVQTINSASAQKWEIAGGRSTSGSGIFARFAVYSSTILTQAQVSNHLNQMLNGGTNAYDTVVAADGATYYWKLNETSGTTAADSVGSNTGTYSGTFTLNNAQDIAGTNGSPSILWQNPSITVAVQQFSQEFYPLTPGGLLVATPASSTVTGVLPSFIVPGLPSNLPNEI